MSYTGLLAKWNAVYNLTAVRDPGDMIVQHLLDSLSVIAPLRQRLPSAEAPRIADVGSGGGLPGLPMAIAWPDARLTLVEPVGKKAAFLRQCVAELSLRNVDVLHDHIETAGMPAPHAFVCRAFASLASFATSIERWVTTDATTSAHATSAHATSAHATSADETTSGVATRDAMMADQRPGTQPAQPARPVVVAMKGAIPAEEIAQLPAAWAATEVVPIAVPGLAAGRCLVFLRRAS